MTWNEENAVATCGSRLRISWVIPMRIVPPRWGAGACACPTEPARNTSIKTATMSETLRFTYAPPGKEPRSYFPVRRAVPLPSPAPVVRPVDHNAVDEHSVDAQVAIEQDQVGARPRRDPPQVAPTEQRGRDC